MTRPRVWAPTPGRVQLAIGAGRLPMTRGDDGWWTADEDVGPGTDYAFALDDDPRPLPDPRSAWQPDGIHGPSRVVDHGAFAWTDQGFRAPPLGSGVVYELHVGAFTPSGTFEGVIERLDHLVGLGVTHVELMPVAEFSGDRGWGYDGVDLYAPHRVYGGPVGLKRLVDACHARGLAVILDVVYNHLGPAGNYLARFGPYFTSTHESPWGSAVNFDAAGSDEVRRFFVDNALLWLRDYHIDGLRLDAVHAIVDMSAVHILEELALEVRHLAEASGRGLVLVAESDRNDPRLLRVADGCGYGLDAQWSDDFHHALHVVLTGESSGYYADFHGMTDLARALREPFVYDGRFSPHRGRRHGRPPGDLPLDRFLGYLQNHDQVGNRATGDRMSSLTSPARLRVGAALVLTAPYVPLLFMGEEWSASAPFLYFTDHRDEELGAAVREGRRTEFRAFGWDPDAIPDPQDPGTFERSRLDWSEVGGGDPAATLDWYRALIALRRSLPDLRDPSPGAPEVRFDEAGCWVVVRRGRVRVAANLGAAAVALDLADNREACRTLLAWPSSLAVGSSGGVWLPPDSVVIVVDDQRVGPNSRPSQASSGV